MLFWFFLAGWLTDMTMGFQGHWQWRQWQWRQSHLCEVSTTERPSLMMLRMAFHRARRALGSIPVVGSSCTDKHQHTTTLSTRHSGKKVLSAAPRWPGGGTDQEDDGRPSNQSDGRRQLPHVAAAVAARRLVHVLDQAQLANAPLCHLVDGRRAGIKAGIGGKTKAKAF